MTQEFDFDLFISYSKYDAPWARKLYADLTALGLDVFMDEKRVEPGTKWRATLSDAVLKSRHLVVLWSENAKTSDWVVNELTKFQLTINPTVEGQPEEGRKLFYVPLEGENKVYEDYQWINDLKTDKAFEKGITNLDANVWSAVLEKISNGVNANADFTPIMLAVLAMTRDRINYLDLTTALPNQETLASAVKKMGILTDVCMLDHLDLNLRLPNGVTLGAELNALGITTQADPDNPGEFSIQLPSGDSLGKTLAALGITSISEVMFALDNNPGLILPNGTALDAFLAGKGLTIPDLEPLMLKVALRQYYGDSPLDWRPFGSPAFRIKTIMSQVKTRFNKKLISCDMGNKRFRWQVSKDFWSATEEGTDERDKLARKKSVIVVDPLSLYDAVTNNRFTKLYKSFENKNALIMAFAPFVLPTPTGIMRLLINDKAVQIFEYFYEPQLVAEKTYAKCGPDVGDEIDINRWLLTALRPEATSGPQVAAKSETAAIMGRAG